MATSTTYNHSALRKAIIDVLLSNFVVLHDAVEPQETLKRFSGLLLQAGIVDRATARNPTYDAIIDNFTAKLPLLPTKCDFETHCYMFIDALRELGGPATQCADKLREEWRSVGVAMGISFDVTDRVPKIVLPPITVDGGTAVHEKFMKLQDKYRDTVDAVVAVLLKKPLVSLKEYIIEYRKEIPQADVSKCTDEESLMALVTSRCSVAQCYLLKFMAEYFKEKRAVEHIKKYDSFRAKVYSEIKASKFSRLLLRKQDYPGEIQVKFIVERANDEYTLANFEAALKAAYGEDFYNIVLTAADHSKLTFICAIPFQMKERFIETTENEADILRSGGVVKVHVDVDETIIKIIEETNDDPTINGDPIECITQNIQSITSSIGQRNACAKECVSQVTKLAKVTDDKAATRPQSCQCKGCTAIKVARQTFHKAQDVISSTEGITHVSTGELMDEAIAGCTRTPPDVTAVDTLLDGLMAASQTAEQNVRELQNDIGRVSESSKNAMWGMDFPYQDLIQDMASVARPSNTRVILQAAMIIGITVGVAIGYAIGGSVVGAIGGFIVCIIIASAFGGVVGYTITGDKVGVACGGAIGGAIGVALGSSGMGVMVGGAIGGFSGSLMGCIVGHVIVWAISGNGIICGSAIGGAIGVAIGGTVGGAVLGSTCCAVGIAVGYGAVSVGGIGGIGGVMVVGIAVIIFGGVIGSGTIGAMGVAIGILPIKVVSGNMEDFFMFIAIGIAVAVGIVTGGGPIGIAIGSGIGIGLFGIGIVVLLMLYIAKSKATGGTVDGAISGVSGAIIGGVGGATGGVDSGLARYILAGVGTFSVSNVIFILMIIALIISTLEKKKINEFKEIAKKFTENSKSLHEIAAQNHQDILAAKEIWEKLKHHSTALDQTKAVALAETLTELRDTSTRSLEEYTRLHEESTRLHKDKFYLSRDPSIV